MRVAQCVFVLSVVTLSVFGEKFYLTPGRGSGVVPERDLRLARLRGPRAALVRGQLEVRNPMQPQQVQVAQPVTSRLRPEELAQPGHIAAVKAAIGNDLGGIYRRQAALAQELKEKETAAKNLPLGTGYVSAYQDSDRSIQTLQDLRDYNARTGAVARQMEATKGKLERAYAR